MAAKRARQSRDSRKTRPAAATRRAAAAGHQVASRVLRQRATALRSREAAIANAPRRARARAVPIAPRFVRAVGPKGVATLVAEGYSWFDYLWYDILDMLESQHGFDVESVAKAGDRIEDIAYTGGQLAKFQKVLEKMLRRVELPKAILLSGGGNDVAGDEFFTLLDRPIQQDGQERRRWVSPCSIRGSERHAPRRRHVSALVGERTSPHEEGIRGRGRAIRGCC